MRPVTLVLKSLPYVDINPYTDEKTQLVSEIKEAVDNLKLVRESKLKAQPAEDLLNEL